MNFPRAADGLLRALGRALLLSACLRFAGECRAVEAQGGAVPTPGSLPVLTEISQFWAIDDTAKQERYPVRFHYVVYYHDLYYKLIWGRIGGNDSYLNLSSAKRVLRPGQNILIEGTMVKANGLVIDDEKITILPEISVLKGTPLKGLNGENTYTLGQLVTFEAYVNQQTELDASHLAVDFVVEGRPISARLWLEPNAAVPQLAGALVRVQGVYVPKFDAAGKIVELNAWIARKEDVHFIGWLDHDQRFNLPVTPIGDLPAATGDTLVRVAGRVLAQEAGKWLTLRDETGQVRLETGLTKKLQPGESVEAIGYTAGSALELKLEQSLFRHAQAAATGKAAGLGPPMLRLADQVRELSPGEAARQYPVRLFGVVTWSHPAAKFFFMQDSSGGVKVLRPPGMETVPAPSGKVAVVGRSAFGGFAPEVEATRVDSPTDFLGLPAQRPVALEQVLTGAEEAQWITLSGYVRAIVRDEAWLRLELSTAAGEFAAMLPPGERVEQMRGSVVRLSGICHAISNPQHQLTGVQLWVPSEEYAETVEAAPADLFTVPERSIASLREFSTLKAADRRVRLGGVVVASAPGRSLQLQEGNESLQVLTRDGTKFALGDRVEVVGFPGRRQTRSVLREAVCRRVATGVPPNPLDLHEPAEINADLDGRLVSLEGRLLEISTWDRGARLTMRSGGIRFDALLDTPMTDGVLADWAPGSRLALTGVYEIQLDEHLHPDDVKLRLRSPGDVRILARPSLWTLRRALIAAGFMAGASLIVLVWVMALRRQVGRQTRQIRAQMEKQARLEAELVRASKLESLGVLAGGIAHDFNNLLTMILGNISLVLHGNGLDQDERNCLREGERAVLRARDLTKQLLTFAKGGAPVRAVVALEEIVRDAARQTLHGSNVRGEFDFAPNLWAAEVDADQVAQVVQNIVINAMQAMPAGGVVRIKLGNEEVTADSKPGFAAGRFLRLDIVDSGPGIRPEILPKIFDPYFSTKEKGGGLGLATVHSIVKKHGGRVEVHTVVDQGTTFQVWLPASTRLVGKNRAPVGVPRVELQPVPRRDPPIAPRVELPPVPPMAPPPTARPAQRQGGRVLVMDDEEFIRHIASALLKRMGYEVTAVADGGAALQEYAAGRAAGRPYDLVIMDLTIPGGMGGAEAIQRLREADPAVRAIVSSGYSNDPVMANFREYGFKGIMPKPYEVDDMRRIVETALDD